MSQRGGAWEENEGWRGGGVEEREETGWVVPSGSRSKVAPSGLCWMTWGAEVGARDVVVDEVGRRKERSPPRIAPARMLASQHFGPRKEGGSEGADMVRRVSGMEAGV